MASGPIAAVAKAQRHGLRPRSYARYPATGIETTHAIMINACIPARVASIRINVEAANVTTARIRSFHPSLLLSEKHSTEAGAVPERKRGFLELRHHPVELACQLSMPASGQSRRFGTPLVTSGPPPFPDIHSTCGHVSKVPLGDILGAMRSVAPCHLFTWTNVRAERPAPLA
jgi:hypothetical protein